MKNPLTEQVCAICENGIEEWEPWQTICENGYRHLVHKSCAVDVPDGESDQPYTRIRELEAERDGWKDRCERAISDRDRARITHDIIANERDAIRAKTIEECAKVAEAFPTRLLGMWDRPGGPPGNGYVDVNGQAYIGFAIRALAQTNESKTETGDALHIAELEAERDEWKQRANNARELLELRTQAIRAKTIEECAIQVAIFLQSRIGEQAAAAIRALAQTDESKTETGE